MEPSPLPRFVFVAYHTEGPHAGPITIGLFGVADGALLPLFPSREKAVDFAVRTLGAPPSGGERWDGVELPAPDLLRFLLGDASIEYVAVNPPPSGGVELVAAQDFAERLAREAGAPESLPEDYRTSFVRYMVYGDVG